MWHIKAHWVDIGNCLDASYICMAAGLWDIRPRFVCNPTFTLIDTYFLDIGLTVATQCAEKSPPTHPPTPTPTPTPTPPPHPQRAVKSFSIDVHRIQNYQVSYALQPLTFDLKCAGTTAAGPIKVLVCIEIINISDPLELDNSKPLTPLKSPH